MWYQKFFLRGRDHEPSSPTTPKSLSKRSSKQNPYSTLGLDKFSMVLAELGAKREMIMANTGSQGVAMVRFMYNNSKDWIPIVIRPKPTPTPTDEKKQLPPTAKPTTTETVTESKAVVAKKPETKRSLSSSRWKPSCYWPLVMVLIMLCLIMFGRVFAICCTSIWWYMVPIVKNWSEANVNKSVKKKNYGRRHSDKRLTSGNALVGTSSQAKKAGGGLHL